MSQQPFSPNALGMPGSGLASRRGGQSIKPLSVDTLKSPPSDIHENSVPTPRTSRSHLLAGLRTAPKSAVATSFASSGTTSTSPTNKARNKTSLYGVHESMLNGPKTSMPQYGNYQQQQQQKQQQQQQTYNNMAAYGQQQIPAEHSPELYMDDQASETQMDPNMLAQLVQQNLQLAQQRQMLQQQLLNLAQAQQQLSAMSMNGQPQQQLQQGYQNLYQQQQQVRSMQNMMNSTMAGAAQPNIYSYVDPTTGQQAYYIDQNAAQMNNQYLDQGHLNAYHQQLQQQVAAPRVQVSPPQEMAQPVFRHSSPPRRHESPMDNHAPLPPPSANAFRRGHKKSSSLMLSNITNNASLTAPGNQDPPRSAGPKTANFPLTPMTGAYAPGHQRAGEHPIRQPRGPPPLDELKAKPNTTFEGSKNFAARTRQSALNNLLRAGFQRRTGSGPNSPGSISPISETAEEAQSPLSDNESDSGRSGSGSLNGEEVEASLPSSRTSTASWGAIGSDRPSSRQNTRKSAGSVSSASGDETASNGSFASVFKRNGRSGRSPATPEGQGQRKAPMLVLTSAEKRKNGVLVA